MILLIRNGAVVREIFRFFRKPNEKPMKTNKLLRGLVTMLIGLLPFRGLAQTYDQLWKEVETYQKKDLPKSVIATAGKIYEKAKKERNLPQMMKAHLVRSSSQVSLTPDSADAEFKALKAWAERETDTVEERPQRKRS